MAPYSSAPQPTKAGHTPDGMTTPCEWPKFHQHPGPVARERHSWSIGSNRGVIRVSVPDKGDLYEYLVAWTRRNDIPHGGFQLLYGGIRELSVMTGRPDRDSGRVATFAGPHTIACPAHVLGGKGVIGRGPDGPALHSHAIFIDAWGNARGCHLLRGKCIADARGIVLAFFAVSAACFRVRNDPETSFDLLFPASA